MTRRYAAAVVFLVLASPFANRSSAAGPPEKIIGNQIICFADGRTIERLLVRNLETGEVRAVESAEIPHLVSATLAATALITPQGLTPWTTRRLPRPTKRLDFNLTSYSGEHRALFNRIIRKLINRERGTKKKPKLRILPALVDVDIEGGSLLDIIDDGVNSIYIHPDDAGLPEVLVGRVGGIASSYWDFETWEWHGADVAFTWRYFEEYLERIVSTVIHEFGHVYGFYHTGWIEDVMSYVRPWRRTEYFWDRSSFIWATSTLKDRMIYGGRRKRSGDYRAKVEVLPVEGSVIAMENLPAVVEPAFRGQHRMFLTTLKGYRDRPMTLSLYRGPEVDETKHIVTISGYSPLMYDDQFRGLLEHYNTSDLFFARQKDFKKLARAVRRRGTPMEIYGVPYTEVLEVTAAITGYEGPEDQEGKTLIRTVLFGNMDPDARW
jgi:hypothetical protein